MYKLVVIAAFLALAAAAPGFVSPYAAPLAPWGHGVVGAPVLSAPIVKTAVPVATSYANTYRVASPVYSHAPVAYAHAPVVAHAPTVLSPYAAYGHGW